MCVFGNNNNALYILEFKIKYKYSNIEYSNINFMLFYLKIDHEQFNKLIVPLRCPNSEGCSGTNLKPLKDNEQYIKDYQEIKIQVGIFSIKCTYFKIVISVLV